jgi:TonB family protein
MHTGSEARAPSFPRWGYLDKFDVNEYMARALTATLGLALAGLAIGTQFGAGVEGLQVAPRTPPFDPGWVSPIPVHILPPPPPAMQPGRPPSVQPRAPKLARIVPVDDALEPPEAAPGFQPGGTGTSPGDALGAAWDDAVLDVPVAPPRDYPSPDLFIAVEKQPELIAMPAPVYPELAREAGVEGEVLVRVLVDRDGFVKKAEVVQSVLGLDEAALDAAAQAVFRPALQQQQPVAVWVAIPIVFRLHG